MNFASRTKEIAIYSAIVIEAVCNCRGKRVHNCSLHTAEEAPQEKFVSGYEHGIR